MKRLSLVLRVLLGLIFLLAAWDKALNPAAFAAIISDYRILPPALVNPAAVTLPWIELALGLLLVSGIWKPGTLFLANLLLVTFWGALLFNYFRGIDVNCGCFSTDLSDTASMEWYLFRDSLFLVLGAAAMFSTLKTNRP
ncbi:MAG: MauE/DoxX family redox-associated membrane protein [Desulfovibrionales bacterium]